jgi:multiple sugar transport system substrate-binding protein
MLAVKALVGREGYAILLPLREWQPLVILALQLGADLLRDEDQYGNFQSPAFRRAFAFYLDLFRRELAPGTAETAITNVYQDFADGFFALYLTGPWNLAEFEHRLAGKAVRWATAPLPSPRGEWPGVSLAGGASLAVSQRSPRKAAAWALVEYLSDPAQQARFATLTGDLPARRAAWAEAGLDRSPNAQAFWTQLEAVRATPKIPEWERIATKITEHAEAAVRGTRDPETALRELDADVDGILAKRRWLLARRERG